MTRQPVRTIAPLTGLRFFAAAWVVFYHYRSDIETLFPRSERVGPLFDAGYAGVDIFFVLSGFIIAYNYLDGFQRLTARGYGRFLWLRLARVYPVHLATVAFFLVALPTAAAGTLDLAGAFDNMGRGDFWAQLGLVHAWGWTGNHAWNYPAWSISAEWVAYLLFPVAALGIVRVKGPVGAWAGLVAGLGFNLAAYLVILGLGRDGEVPMVRILGEFVAGCFLFLLWRAGQGAGWRWDMVAPLAFAAGFAAAIASEWAWPGGSAAVVTVPVFTAGIYALAHERGWLARFLVWRPCIYGGEISYSLYMTHAVAQFVLWRQLPTVDYASESLATRAGLLLLYAIAILGLAVGVYHVVEQPGRNGMRRVLGRRTRPRPAEAPAGEPTLTRV